MYVVNRMKENKPELNISFSSESDELLFWLWSEIENLSQLFFLGALSSTVSKLLSVKFSPSVCNQSALNRGSKNVASQKSS